MRRLRHWAGRGVQIVLPILDLISIAGIPDDLRAWATWLGPVHAVMVSDPARWGLAVVTAFAFGVPTIRWAAAKFGGGGSMERQPQGGNERKEHEASAPGGIHIGGVHAPLGISQNQRGGQTGGVIYNVGPQPRTLKGADVSDALARLAQHRDTHVRVAPLTGAAEGATLAQEVRVLLVRAGWVVDEVGQATVAGISVPPGIVVDDPSASAPEPLDAFTKSMQELGLRAERAHLDLPGPSGVPPVPFILISHPD